MKTTVDKASEKLKEVMSQYDSLCIAFSGGTDSTLLAEYASKHVKVRVLLVHVKSIFTPAHEKNFASSFAENRGLEMEVLEMNPLELEKISENSMERCYHCKKHIMFSIREKALEKGIKIIADGTNVSDFDGYRPGLKASNELSICHPLAEAKLDKRLIRLLARRAGLSNWRQPAAACLATRIPYGEKLTFEKIRMIRGAEDLLHSFGYPECRIRLSGNKVRVEVSPLHIRGLCGNRLKILSEFRSLGIEEIYIDLKGYRSGVYDPA